ncbi:asparagine synthase (glutamine-hydrolyzing) [Alteromonas sp.]|uniref:asparagine synthase (glutamine-hydrolyzing) n=1 Tax=Alteromonas sp. TaxID=232 RepID=UPI000B71935A|nr:asparagine synthase (glutamine-hydrolyzing) [Alteromonas sp.]MAI37316.1 asparagine synthase (glutamine-hydrolyzing) [Alteromonas sp.]OUX88900.1 MAG: asparagine synthase (glutamine-hydrolyzing) [Alteromonas sp. TMED35]|tara:strand:+ start:13748 stop:15634 length:1887 start_codon:yes stop_codon:yes gene_type:complete
MCGIAGFSLFNYNEGGEKALHAMHHAILHRGPDASGTYLDEHIGLCHRRLSILDLSEAGNQPMYSADGNLVIVFNGEIYNFLEIRAELEQQGVAFKSHTDTEVILELYAREGIQCLQKLNGMFAFALWDKAKQELFIARDRLGKKPLYYYSQNGRFAFGSEIKAILALENIPREIRLDAVYDFFAYQYVPDPKSIFQHIHKLPPAHYLILNRDGFSIHEYWDLSFKNTSKNSEADNKLQLKALLEKVTKQRMISDVPLGAFLSGGVDSSGVVAMMSEASETPVKTCTIGFDNKDFNEADFAREIAKKYNTEHHEYTVNQNVADRLEHIVSFFDEPFADPSLVPTYFVSELARKAVTVALAGDGGDEMFAGYEKYTTDDIENKLRNKFPESVRKTLFPALASLAGKVPGKVGKKAKSLLTTLSHDAAMGFYITNSMITDEMWNSLVKQDVAEKLKGYHPSHYTIDTYHKADGPDHLSKILYTDIKTYMSGDILVKVDRMSMANSLEVRAPILDYQVAEFAATLPSSQKYRNGEKKYLLKEVFKPFIPDSLLYRKKMGFSTPLDEWFRGELKELAHKELIDDSSGLSEFFDTKEIKRIWHGHISSRSSYGAILWSLLCFKLWYKHYVMEL